MKNKKKMSQEEIDEIKKRYSHDDLPPVKNWPLYIYYNLLRIFSFVLVGTGAILIALLVEPILILGGKKKFKTRSRKVISATFNFFINLVSILGGSKYKFHGKEKLLDAKGKIIVANHPSYIDVVYLIACIKNADCIIRGTLAKSVFAGVARPLYIMNTVGNQEMLDLSKKSLEEGANIIIFPEGTRTPRHGTNQFKRGAARIALNANCSIIPVYIGGSDKYGLGKHDPAFSYLHEGHYVFDIHVLDEIKIEEYKDMEAQIAARRITERIHKEIADTAMAVDGRIV